MEWSWQVQAAPPDTFFAEHPELPRPIATILYHRGIRSQEAIDEFLHPDYSVHVHDPFLFQGMQKAVDRIFAAIAAGELITIHGDYDADGVSASVILTDTLHTIGAMNVSVFLPHRETDGYGLNMRTVEYLAEAETKLIITCDCGISNKQEIARAKKLGMDVIITDHHSIPAELPEALAIIHPKVEGEPYPDKTLAGGGVAFKLAQALLRTDEHTHEGFEKWLLDMVAIASVADMVPLLGESRTLTQYGLIVLNKTRRLGLQKLLLNAKLVDADSGELMKELDAHSIGFHIAPRINAAGRMDHANVAYELLTEKDPERAAELAHKLEENNTQRRAKTERFVEDAIRMIEEQKPIPSVIGVFHEEWSTGITGLIASKLKDTYQKPAIAMAPNKGEITGSGRSIAGFNLVHALGDLSSFFSKFGGHPMACGFTLKDAAAREPFLAALSEYFDIHTADMNLSPTLEIDARVTLADIDFDLFTLLDQCRPFGQCNEIPRYLTEGVIILAADTMGKTGSHLRLQVQDEETKTIRKAVGWSLGDWATRLSVGGRIDLVFEVGVHEWNGSRELQLIIIDIKKSV